MVIYTGNSMVSYKTEIIIKVICIIILITLCISIYINGKDLSCDNCQVKIQKDNKIVLININTLYEDYVKDRCTYGSG